MRNQNDDHSLDLPDSLPTILAALNSILLAPVQRIVEYLQSDLKTDSVLSPVELGFVGVPCEHEVSHGNNIITEM